jgi:hypothetical protein
MDAFNHGHPAIGQPVDDTEMPERPASVKGLGEQLATQVPELMVLSWTGQGGGFDMVGYVEVKIIGPYRRGTRKHGALQVTSKLGHQIEPLGNASSDFIESQVALWIV